MLAPQLIERWNAKKSEFEACGVMVDGGKLIGVLLRDLMELEQAEATHLLSLREAARYSGYSEAHLGRLVRDGELRTLRPPGSRGRLTFRPGDLPRKPVGKQVPDAGVHDLASRLSKPRGKEGRYGQL